MSYCVFCERTSLETRIFYDQHNWYAFLTAPPYTKGQTILTLKKLDTQCPTGLTAENLKGLDVAIADVSQMLLSYYHPKDILVASLRGRDPHIHFHLIPLWEEEELAWRKCSLRKKGYLLEYLGHVEHTAETRIETERAQNGLSEDEHRDLIIPQLQPDVTALRALSFYEKE
jgi:diadenosine tetraphosphate (Ap4A) HIT family hydrolase